MIIIYASQQQNRYHFTQYLIAVDGNMAAKLFSSQNKSSSSEYDCLTLCNMHLTLQYAENIACLLQCKVNGNLFRYRYIIIFDITLTMRICRQARHNIIQNFNL